MKNDITITFLNFVLAVLVIACVVFAVLAMNRERDLRQIRLNATVAQVTITRATALLNDVNAYNARVKSPELTSLIQGLQQKTH
jgi:hypothetical protein